jgi:two-component system NtrC family sensor kinase
LNLLVNATHACGQERGLITVRTGTADGQLWLSISDTGCGIDRAHLDSIFEPYFTTKPAGVGTGLGLALVRTIVERHHGSVEVDSELGRGSTFRITLPIASAGNGDIVVREL